MAPLYLQFLEHLYLLLAVDGAIFIERFEGSDDNFIVIGTTGVLHTEGEQRQPLGEVERSRCLIDHLVEFLLVGQFTNSVEGGPEVALADDAVFVVVHKLETLFELGDLSLGEHGEDIGT